MYLIESPTPSLKIDQEGDNVLIIGLNRIEKRNAINDELILGIEKIFDSITNETKCIIIQGLGEHFSAGLDLSELQERNTVEGLKHSRMWHRILDKVQFGSCPVIAVLQGAVVGGGLELAAACHIRIASPTTFYALPEGQRGIFVGGGASVRLPKLIGLTRMTDMMLTGRAYNAHDGERLGFAQYLVEDNGLSKAKEIAKKIVSNAGMTNYAVTHILPKINDSPHNEGLMMESLIAAIAQDAPEAKKRLADFLEGRAKKVSVE
jgi:enoyl-CoA hydratase/carnithine racemase